MGLCLSYMNKPDTKKYSSDESNDKLNCGASCMQGWRDSQQDAHNCIIDYDKDTAYFAVYDGHGGDEIAIYCSEELPNFLKSLADYKDGKIKKALEEAFLKFDATILTDEISKKLQKLRDIAASKQKNYTEDDDDDEEEDVDNLYQEAAMPIEEVIEKYKKGGTYKKLAAKLKEELSSTSASSSTPSSTSAPETSSETASCAETDSPKKESSVDKNLVPESKSIETGEANSSSPVLETKVDSPDSSADTREVCTPSDNVADTKESTNQNGKVKSTQECESSKPDVSSSSATPHENGEVVKKRKGKAVMKTKGVVPKTSPSQRSNRNTNDLCTTSLDGEEGLEEESEDENDETFEGPNENSSDDDDDDEDTSRESSEGSSGDEKDGEEEEEEEEEDEDEENEENRVRSHEFLENMKEAAGFDSGTTAVVALLKGNELYVANAGDSRCVVCRNGEAIEMSFDHKPEDTIEYNRIKKAGGYIDMGRVNGGLNLSRAIGDHAYKQNNDLPDREQSISALPDVKSLTLKPDEDEFMVLACDGIWNSLTSQEVVDFVRMRIQKGKGKLSEICEELFDHCLAPCTFSDSKGCDNMTAVIVQFKNKTSLKKPLSYPEESGRCKKIKLDEEAST